MVNGEILKRPTRADCKSAVKTSQVRILLSPQNRKKIKDGEFDTQNFLVKYSADLAQR
jgi:hypothetical protein